MYKHLFLFDGRVSRKLYEIICSLILQKVNGTVAMEYEYRLTIQRKTLSHTFLFHLSIFHLSFKLKNIL